MAFIVGISILKVNSLGDLQLPFIVFGTFLDNKNTFIPSKAESVNITTVTGTHYNHRHFLDMTETKNTWLANDILCWHSNVVKIDHSSVGALKNKTDIKNNNRRSLAPAKQQKSLTLLILIQQHRFLLNLFWHNS